MADKITLEVSRDGWTGKLQLSIQKTDERGVGNGYRIAGPKFNGSGETLLVATLDKRDRDEIRSYLDTIETDPELDRSCPTCSAPAGEDCRGFGYCDARSALVSTATGRTDRWLS